MRYLLGRLRHLTVVLFLVTFLTFLLVNVLPGDIAYDIAGLDASEEEVQQIREDLGLNRPFLIRYFEWLGGVLTGDWGQSFRTGLVRARDYRADFRGAARGTFRDHERAAAKR